MICKGQALDDIHTCGVMIYTPSGVMIYKGQALDDIHA